MTISETDLNDFAYCGVRPTTADGQAMAREILRLRGVLTKIAEDMCETPIGFIAERALMTEDQRIAIDLARATPSGGQE